ncbi:MAG: hypothetical protein WDO13_05955 [Verrucomicrobiota bacterium]
MAVASGEALVVVGAGAAGELCRNEASTVAWTIIVAMSEPAASGEGLLAVEAVAAPLPAVAELFGSLLALLEWRPGVSVGVFVAAAALAVEVSSSVPALATAAARKERCQGVVGARGTGGALEPVSALESAPSSRPDAALKRAGVFVTGAPVGSGMGVAVVGVAEGEAGFELAAGVVRVVVAAVRGVTNEATVGASVDGGRAVIARVTAAAAGGMAAAAVSVVVAALVAALVAAGMAGGAMVAGAGPATGLAASCCWRASAKLAGWSSSGAGGGRCGRRGAGGEGKDR